MEGTSRATGQSLAGLSGGVYCGGIDSGNIIAGNGSRTRTEATASQTIVDSEEQALTTPGRIDIGQKRGTTQPTWRHQFDCAFRRLELRSVCFTSSRWPTRFQRSGDATAADLEIRQLLAVNQTAAVGLSTESSYKRVTNDVSRAVNA